MYCSMKYLAIFLLSSILIKQSSGDALIDILVGIASGIESFISTTLTSNCTSVKTSLGWTYQQMIAANRTPNMMKLELELYTPTGVTKFNISSATADIVKSPKFNKTLPITLFIHGYLTNDKSINVLSITKALMKRGGTNVLFLNASEFIFLFYLYASTVIQFIGEGLGKLLVEFKNAGISPSSIHLIGHSLGAHISGFAGQIFYNKTGTKIARISGLDPAGPCFFTSDPDFQLSPNDAEFVDVIHTDAGVFGIVQPIGHVDFYPNGGCAQTDALIPGENHGRSWEYYNETIYPSLEKKFLAVKCTNWTVFNNGSCLNNERGYMGYGVSKSLRGSFFLRTGGCSPYGLGDTGIIAVPNAFQAFLNWLSKILV